MQSKVRKTVSLDRDVAADGDAAIAAGWAESWSALVETAVAAHVRRLELATIAEDARTLDAEVEAAAIRRVQAAAQPASARWSSLRAR